MSVELARQARRPYTHPQRKPEITQTIQLQEAVVTRCLDPQTPSDVLAQLGRTFVALGEHKRILRMKPAPKAIDTTKIPPKKKRASEEPMTPD